MWLLSCLPAQASLAAESWGGGAASLKQTPPPPPRMPMGLWWQGLAREAGSGRSKGDVGAFGTRHHLEIIWGGQRFHSRILPGTGARSHTDHEICFQGEAGTLLVL